MKSAPLESVKFSLVTEAFPICFLWENHFSTCGFNLLLCGNPGGEEQAAKMRKLATPVQALSGIMNLIAFTHNFLVCRADRYSCEHSHAVLWQSFGKQPLVSPSPSYPGCCEQSFGLTAASAQWVCEGLWNSVSCLLSSCAHHSQACAVGRCLGV